MCRKDTHAVRGKRSKRDWKPTCKGILNHYAKERQKIARMIRGIGCGMSYFT